MKCLLFPGFIFFLTFSCFPLLVSGQQKPTIAWDKTFGGSGKEQSIITELTPDGGYIIGGATDSGISGDVSQASRGGEDFWIVKTDAKGNKQWDKRFGGRAQDALAYIVPTADGGYILGGNSFSGISGDVSQGTLNNMDYWILKIDSTGNKLWDKIFTANSSDFLYYIRQTSDGGFILGGTSNSTIGGAKSEPNRSNPAQGDFWIIKLNSNGDKLWDKTFGGSSHDDLWVMLVTTDGGFILGGHSKSGIGGDKSQPSQGLFDYWVVKLDGNGNKVWDKTFGGIQTDILTRLIQTKDGGYLLGGFSDSGISGDKTAVNKGKVDFWMIKLDGAGNKTWDKSIGGIEDDQLFGIEQSFDGGYVLCGISKSGISGDKTEALIGGTDFWIVKVDTQGNLIWDKTIGANNNDEPFFIRELANGEILVCGRSNSGISGHKTQPNKGLFDFWLVKLNAPCTNLTASLTPECITGGTKLNLSVKAIQNLNGKYSWNLQYLENGLTKTKTDSTGTITLVHNAKPGTVIQLVSITSGTCTTSLNQTFTMPAYPDYPVAKNVSRCGPGKVTLTASGAPAGSKYVWYNVPTNGTPLQTDSTGKFTTPELKEPTLYYVAAQNKLGCEGPRAQVLVSLNYCPPVYIPNIITQNNDGKNETFQPQNLS